MMSRAVNSVFPARSWRASLRIIWATSLIKLSKSGDEFDRPVLGLMVQSACCGTSFPLPHNAVVAIGHCYGPNDFFAEEPRIILSKCLDWHEARCAHDCRRGNKACGSYKESPALNNHFTPSHNNMTDRQQYLFHTVQAHNPSGTIWSCSRTRSWSRSQILFRTCRTVGLS